jgi:hypothetical protein
MELKMRIQRSRLCVVVLAACLFPQLVHADIVNTLELRGKMDPALAGLDVNKLAIDVAGDADSNSYAELLRSIESLTRNNIYMACKSPPSASLPKTPDSSSVKSALRVNVNIVDLDANSSICFVQTRLIRTVCLAGDCSVSFEAVVWETPPAVEKLSRQMPQVVLEKIVSEQTKAFIHSYIMSNPKLLSNADKGTPKQASRPASNVSDEKPAFVASKNSQVFHKASCPSAKRIATGNLVSYATRDEAIAAGKRPCERCNP